MLCLVTSALAMSTSPATVETRRRPSELWDRKTTEANGIVWRGNHTVSPLPHETLGAADLPESFTWCDKDGVNYCTMSRNQHIPQYCGSCWAHGAVSALADRIKIARGAKGIDINLSVQHMLNCGTAGSCHGGSVDGPYQWIHSISDKTGTGISYETQQPYLACSSESKDGICAHADWSCTPENVARTCSTFPESGGTCTGLAMYPNATVSEYGSVSGADAMAKEIFARGPISCGIDAAPIVNYHGGVAKDAGDFVDHVISVVGWGTDATEGPYWIVRNVRRRGSNSDQPLLRLSTLGWLAAHAPSLLSNTPACSLTLQPALSHSSLLSHTPACSLTARVTSPLAPAVVGRVLGRDGLRPRRQGQQRPAPRGAVCVGSARRLHDLQLSVRRGRR